MYHLVFVLADDGQFPEESESDDEQMEIIPLQTPSQYLY